MKTVFIVNPCAGKGNKDALLQSFDAIGDDSKNVYITKGVGDATLFVREYIKNHGPARFIACGGDGTFSEVLGGAIESEGSEIGVFPCGTGNDFCRNFASDCLFESILNQMNGEVIKCDAIKYTTETEDGIKEGYCANMFNIGFDANVADLTGQMKKKTFISGSFAYLISIFVTLIRKKGADLTVETDGEISHNGKLLLASIANGSFCGGGIMSNPLASVTDGIMDINIIKNISRLRFLHLFPYYKKGTHMDVKNIEKVITVKKCREIVIIPRGGKMRLCIDGEIIDAGKTKFEICPGAFNFVLPKVPKTDYVKI